MAARFPHSPVVKRQGCYSPACFSDGTAFCSWTSRPTTWIMASVRWLEGFLRSYSGSYIVISHDRYFLDKTTDVTLGLSNGRITSYMGNYSDFIKKKEADDAAKAKSYELKKKEIKRIEGIIAQQKQWNRERNIKTAESKQKMIDRIAATMETPEEKEAAINFSFSAKEGGANEVLTVTRHKEKLWRKRHLIRRRYEYL